MGKVFGTKHFRDQADTEQGIEYPPLPRPLLRMIYSGQRIQVSRRASSYIVFLGNNFIQADDVSVSKWVLRTYGDQLDSEKFELACTLLCERIRHEIAHHERETRRLEREEERASRSTWGAGNDLKGFFGR
ncbi:hypothetical protein Asch03_02140 [Acinetobacter schindleri]